jgi:SAM-dependent methyltransferase
MICNATVDSAAPALPRVVSRTCPICKSNDFTGLIRRPPWRLVQCRVCSLAYLPEHPSNESLDTDYEWDDSFARERWERWARNPLARAWTMAALFLKPSREKRALRFIRRHVRDGRLIDIGCGDGRLLFVAQRAGFDVLGVESSPKMAAKARRRIGSDRVFCGRLADSPAQAASFDAAVTVSYLEHEPQPLEALKRMHSLLKPGGVCIHKVPNYDSLLRMCLGRRWSGYRWPEHMQYYTPTTLTRLLGDAGFETLAVRANPFGDNFWIAARARPG